MNYSGLIIGLASFLIIGLFHPLVIKGEYYFGTRIWPCFLVLGIVFSIASVLINHIIPGAVAGVLGFTSFWSIRELFEQRERVRKGWFPENPSRKGREQDPGSGA